MKDHPHELLAEYVDGALGPDQRASVETHLSSCRSCSEEVELARHGREALSTLPEVPAPAGIALDIRRRARRPSRAGRWIAAAAAAALAVAGVLVVGRGLVETQGSGGEGAEGGGGQAAPADPGPDEGSEEQGGGGTPEALGARATADASDVVYLVSDRNYDPASLAELAPRLRARATASLRAGFAGTTERFFSDLKLDTVPPKARRAIRCASEGLPPNQPAAPFRIEAARFQGEPVYVAAFLRGPNPQARHDRVLIWVVTRDSCELRYFASQRL
jgi:Putative zinc-finger